MAYVGAAGWHSRRTGRKFFQFSRKNFSSLEKYRLFSFMPVAAVHPSAVHSPALLKLQDAVADSFALVMEARTGVLAKTAFDVAELLQLSAHELANLLHTTTKTLRTYRQPKSAWARPSASKC